MIPFIKTDNKLSASKRFLLILNEYFSEKGFVFQKSKNKFVKKFPLGTQTIFIPFHNYRPSGLASAEMYFFTEFAKLEDIYSDLMEGKPYWDRETLHLHLKSYAPFQQEIAAFPDRYSKVEKLGRVDLFDEMENNVPFTDDVSLNRAANTFLANYEVFVLPFFTKNDNYASLAFLMNGYIPLTSNPIFSLNGIPKMPEKWIVLGVILAHFINREEVRSIVEAYKEYISQLAYSENDKTRFLLLLQKTLNFVNQNDLSKIIDL